MIANFEAQDVSTEPHPDEHLQRLETYQGNKFKSKYCGAGLFLDLYVRDHRSMDLKVWKAREKLAVIGISHSTFIIMITIM